MKVFKYLYYSLAVISFLCCYTLKAQDNVGIGTLTPNEKALLDLSANDKGFLVPRLNTTQRLAIAPAGTIDAALLVYDTDDNFFYFWNSTQWIPIPQLGSTNISLNYNNASGELELVDDGGTLTTNIPTNTDEQTLTLTGTDLEISNGNTVDLSPFLNTDNQNLTVATLVGNTLTVEIENGNPVSVDLSALIGTDEQDLTAATLTGTILTIDIENGASVTVDLASLIGTDNQDLTAATLVGTDLTIDIENGASVTVDLGSLVGTDNQNLTSATLVNDVLTIEIEDGNPVSVDLSDLGNDWKLIGNAGTNSNTNFLGTTDAQDLVFRTNNIERVRTLGANGNVGIGLANPQNKLDVSGNIAIGTFAGVNVAPANGLIVSGNVRIGIPVASTLNPNQVDAAIIKLDQTGGYARLGNYNSDPGFGVAPGTSWAGGVGALAIGMNRNSGTSNVDFWNTSANGQAAANGVNDRGFNWRRYDQTGNEELLMTLNGTGNLTISGANYNTSDKRLKSNIRPLENQILEKILKLQPYTYSKTNSALNEGNHMFYSESDASLEDFGFLAQEVYEIFPELVYKPEDENKELWAVDYARLSVMLAKALQEQQAIVDALKNENKSLKASFSDNSEELENLKSEIERIKSFIFQKAQY